MGVQPPAMGQLLNPTCTAPPLARDEHRLPFLQHELDRDGFQKVGELLQIRRVQVHVRLRLLVLDVLQVRRVVAAQVAFASNKL